MCLIKGNQALDLKEREALGDNADTHWYYVSKARMVAGLLPKKPNEILDVGAGVGWFSRWFVENGYASCATCVDPGYASEHEENLAGGQQIRFLRSIDSSDADLVLLMDVLEHVDDDVELLKTYWAKAKPGAVFVITVPAFQFLWSAHDDYLDHRRRYTASQLAETITRAGAKPEQLNYYYASIFPIAVLVRFLRRNRASTSSDMRPASPLVNTMLTGLLRLEAPVARWNRLAGLSVVALFQKKA